MFKNAIGVSLQERNKVFLDYLKIKSEDENVILRINSRLYLFNDEAVYLKKKYQETQVFQAYNFNSIVLELEQPTEENFEKFKDEIHKDKPEYNFRSNLSKKNNILNEIVKEKSNNNAIYNEIPSNILKKDVNNNIIESKNNDLVQKIKKQSLIPIKFSKFIFVEEDFFENNRVLLLEFFNKYKLNHLRLNFNQYFMDLKEFFNLKDENEVETLLWQLNLDINDAVLNYYLKKHIHFDNQFQEVKQQNFFVVPNKYLDNHLLMLKEQDIVVIDQISFKSKIADIYNLELFFKNCNKPEDIYSISPEELIKKDIEDKVFDDELIIKTIKDSTLDTHIAEQKIDDSGIIIYDNVKPSTIEEIKTINLVDEKLSNDEFYNPIEQIEEKVIIQKKSNNLKKFVNIQLVNDDKEVNKNSEEMVTSSEKIEIPLFNHEKQILIDSELRRGSPSNKINRHIYGKK